MYNNIDQHQLSPDYYISKIPQEFTGLFSSCKYIWDLVIKHSMLFDLLVKQEISEKVLIHPRVEISGLVRIGKGTVIQSNVRIEGPVIIGENCNINHSVSIRPYTYIHNNCVLGHSAEIKNSLLFPFSKVSGVAFVGDSVLGPHARIAGGAKLSNRRFDQKQIVIKAGNMVFNTGLYHFGCVLGEHARIGANAATNPGTFIGPHTFIQGLVNARGFIPKNSFVESKQNIKISNNSYTSDLTP